MLVLSRKLEESFIINGNIEVIVTAIQGHKVSLGISAPADVKIFRKELFPILENGERSKMPPISESPDAKNNWNFLSGVQTLR